ncbi:hypothetical protein [Xanthovirga aplysinae]|uniref:hypothetical protein n=1 Tax=Xanthovirga aplysinae TaxID=2529853 RepID=UPI0012BD21AA|nr:hypothetical protein [Xanthovirga aplysinae]MTI30269.1 hypothetical protein [Xanthovirga aplysinae]
MKGGIMSREVIQIIERETPKKEKSDYSEFVVRISASPEIKIAPEAKQAKLKIQKPLVEKVEGPFTEDGKQVEEMVVGNTYIFKATEFQSSIFTPIKHIWWAEEIEDNGKIEDLPLDKENLFKDDKGAVCFKYTPKKSGKIRIYAYVSNPSKKVSIETTVYEAIKKEIVLIAGTEQHSASYGNKLMFPAQAIREVYKNYSKEEYLTIILFKDGYNSEQIQQIKESAVKHNKNVNYKEVANISQVIDYFNKGDRETVRNKPNSKNHLVKIGEIKIFAHGLPSIFDFGLDGPNEFSQRFKKEDVVKLDPKVFDLPVIHSYACRTGNTDASEFFGENWETLAKPEESLAQNLADYLDATVFAFINRSNYIPTWDDKQDANYQKGYEEIEDEDVNGRIYKPWNWDETLWHDNGAYGKPRAGTSPVGLPETMYKFQKGKKPTPKL